MYGITNQTNSNLSLILLSLFCGTNGLYSLYPMALRRGGNTCVEAASSTLTSSRARARHQPGAVLALKLAPIAQAAHAHAAHPFPVLTRGVGEGEEREGDRPEVVHPAPFSLYCAPLALKRGSGKSHAHAPGGRERAE